MNNKPGIVRGENVKPGGNENKHTTRTRGKSYIESGKKRATEHENYNIRVSEMIVFLDQARTEQDGVWNAIESAFYMGIEAGYRIRSRERVRA